LFVAIGRPLKTEWILDALLRVIRTDDPGPGARTILVAGASPIPVAAAPGTIVPLREDPSRPSREMSKAR
jgi:hypothetical protein